MTVLVLGATGFIGPHLVRALEARGCEVIAGARSQGVDRRDVAAVRALARACRVSVVVDLLAYTEGDTLPLLDALEGETERWVMASSCDVYRNYEGLHRRAVPAPIKILDEDAPLRHTRYPYRTDPPRAAGAPDVWRDAYDKIPLEAAVGARSGHVILRLPMVFGPGDRQRRFRWLLKPMLSGADRLMIDPTWAAWRASYGYVEDIADAIAHAALHPASVDRTFNLGPPAAPDHRTWIDGFAAVLNWNGTVVETPSASPGPLAALNLTYPLVVDARAFREICAWVEPTLQNDVLTRTIADERARG